MELVTFYVRLFKTKQDYLLGGEKTNWGWHVLFWTVGLLARNTIVFALSSVDVILTWVKFNAVYCLVRLPHLLRHFSERDSIRLGCLFNATATVKCAFLNPRLFQLSPTLTPRDIQLLYIFYRIYSKLLYIF